MRRSHRALVLATLMAVAISILTAGAAQCDLTRAERVALGVNDHQSALEFVTALTGPQIATLASGKTIPLDDLGEAARAQILHAARTRLGDAVYHDRLDELSPDTKLGIAITGEAVLTLQNPSFGSSGEMRITLDKYRSTTAPKVGQVANPPSLESIANSLPVNVEERLTALRQLTSSMLSVVSNAQLDGKIPFALSDQPKGITAKVPSLSAEQSKWICRVYEAHRQDVVAQQVLLKQYEIAHGRAASADTILADGNGHTASVHGTPSYTMPAWNDIADGTTAQLSVGYTLFIKAISGACRKGIGWTVYTEER